MAEAPPRTVGIIIMPSAFLLCYLLAAAELCIGVVSWGARELTDAKDAPGCGDELHRLPRRVRDL
jgi:hypothetical protein